MYWKKEKRVMRNILLVVVMWICCLCGIEEMMIVVMGLRWCAFLVLLLVLCRCGIEEVKRGWWVVIDLRWFPFLVLPLLLLLLLYDILLLLCPFFGLSLQSSFGIVFK